MGDHTVPGLTELTGKNWHTSLQQELSSLMHVFYFNAVNHHLFLNAIKHTRRVFYLKYFALHCCWLYSVLLHFTDAKVFKNGHSTCMYFKTIQPMLSYIYHGVMIPLLRQEIGIIFFYYRDVSGTRGSDYATSYTPRSSAYDTSSTRRSLTRDEPSTTSTYLSARRGSNDYG